MKRIWKTIIDAGVRPEMSVGEARFVIAGNIIAICSALWLSLLIATTLPYLPAVRHVLLTCIACVVGLCLVPVLNGRGLYLTAQSYQTLLVLFTVTVNTLHFGQSTWHHLLLLGTIALSFCYIRSIQILTATTLVGLCLFASLEGWFAYGRPGFFEDDASLIPFLALIRYASVYALVAVSMGCAFYSRMLLNPTPRTMDMNSERSEALESNILPGPIV